MRILGIDPGAVHVGISDWSDQLCLAAGEWTPDELATFIRLGGLASYEVVVVEAYSSQGGFGSAKAGVATTELIGFMAWSIETSGVSARPRLIRVGRGERHAALQRLEAAGYEFRGKGISNHARDAEAVVVAGMRWKAVEVVESNRRRLLG